MLYSRKDTEVKIGPAKVIAAYPDHRIVDIKWLFRPTTRHNVMVVTDPNSYSFPQVGDVGLIIGTATHDYFIGKIELAYKEKIEGVEGNSSDRPTDEQGNPIYARKVNPGDVFLAPLLRAASIFISAGGGFSLSAKSGDGIAYYVSNRLMQIASKVAVLSGQGVTATFGKVLRTIGTTRQVVMNPDFPTSPATESLIEVVLNTLRVARLHLGNVMDAYGNSEKSSFSMKLKAIMEVCSVAGTTIAKLLMDESGNIELESTLGKVRIASALPNGILLGSTAAAQHAVRGESLISYLTTYINLLYNKHTHTAPPGGGATGMPIVQASPPDTSLLNTTVVMD